MKELKWQLFILFVTFGLCFYPNVIKAEEYSSDYISIDETSYSYNGEDFSLSQVYFKKDTSNFGDLTSYGVLYGDMINTSNHYLSAFMTIDYYDSDYQIIARSTKTETPGLASENYFMNIILYEKDFLKEVNFESIKYFKINYYTIKGAPLPEGSKNSSRSSSGYTIAHNYQYNSYDYVIDKYDINIVVNENNTFDITEIITAYFNVPKHGIFRTIPLRNKITRLDGSTSTNHAQISNVDVDNEYSVSRENGNYKLKIGSANRTITGKQTYVIKYTYNIGKDPVKNYDEIYYNIIGTEWDTVLGNITFSITMPKDFDSNKLGFSYGKQGSIENSNITYTVNETTIVGKYNGVLNPGEALTVRCELPEGYFVGAELTRSKYAFIIFIVPIISLLIAFITWFKHGRDNQVIETVEFYPPKDFNSLDVGFAYKGNADSKDVTSLLIYLANKGYIKISETEEKMLFSKSKGFKIDKVKDYDGANENEKMFLEGLFTPKVSVNYNRIKEIQNQAKQRGEKIRYMKAYEQAVAELSTASLSSVKSSDLYDNFYLTTNKILKNKNSKDNKYQIFEKVASKKSIIVVLAMIASLVSTMFLPSMDYGGIEGSISSIFVIICYSPFIAVSLSSKVPLGIRIFIGIFILFHLMFMCSTLPIADAILTDKIYLYGTILGVLCLIGIITFLKLMPKRTQYGNEILGKLKGFKNFLETAEKEKLEAMVMQDPTYFYNILPYTYVLGVSDKWIKKFETISMQAPTWYDSPNEFNFSMFNSFMNSTMTTAQSTMSSSSSSSGGGSSGGGSGGGGGGSW